jgi:formylglycine-generating enzyme required for sulfatase activity
MTLIEAGPLPAEGDGRATWLLGFFIDVDPVSNTRYGRFVRDTGYPAPPSWPDGECPGALLDEPVRTGRAQARAYAVWAGKALPSRRQWERAARGDEGLSPPRGPEWRTDDPGGADRPFRCVVAAPELLQVLAL